MASKQNPNNSTYFPFNKLKDLLHSEKIVCVLGYGLSEGYAPHYYDIQHGAWSSVEKALLLKPFSNQQHFEMVLNWFNWRRAGTKTKQSIMAFNEISLLRKGFNISVGTQNVDGFHRINNLDNIYELYGCVLDTRSITNENLDCQAFEKNSDEMQKYSGKRLDDTQTDQRQLPDVDMFGWNSKAITRAEFLKLSMEAELIIKIGCDDFLSPFSEMDDENKKARLKITTDGIEFSLDSCLYKLPLLKIEDHLNSNIDGIRTPVKTVADVIKYLYTMYR